MAQKLNDDELVSIIERRTDMAETRMAQIRREREQSLEYYNQEPYGDEQEGRSGFVSSDVRDTIEWILPQLIEMFIGGDNPVTFTPRNQDDIDAAKQESEYVRYVANEQNNGFINLYEWFKDALISKNGIMKTYWDDDEVEEKEEYENQSFSELQQLASDTELEVEEISVKTGNKEQTFKGFEAFSAALTKGKIDFENPETTYGAKGVRKEDLSHVDEYVVPPENFFVDANQTEINLDDTAFCREDMYLTESDLLEMGVDQSVIDTIPSGDNITLSNTENDKRYKKEGGLDNQENLTEKATRRIKVSDIYIKVDMDGDGIAERRFIKLAGDNVVLENEETNYIPYSSITPNILTHKFYGMSIADMVADLQRLHSVLWRQTLDSLYLSNDPRKIVLEGQVNLDDLLTSRPGGIVRSQVPGAVQDLTVPFVGAASLPVMDRIEMMREQRTGVSQATQGLDPSALADSTNMVGAMIMNAAQQRIKMIARIFAEVGMKPRMMKIHELLLKHEKNEKIADLHGEFVPVKPSTWRTRRDLKAKVGVGFSERKEKIISLERVLQAQQDIFAAQQGEGPLLNSMNVYNALMDLQELTGMEVKDRYFSNPENFQAPPPEEDIASETLEIAEAEITFKAQEAAAKHELEVQKHFDEINQKNRALAIKEAEVMLKAAGDEEERELKKIFKQADMAAEELNRRRDSVKEIINKGVNNDNTKSVAAGS